MVANKMSRNEYPSAMARYLKALIIF
jgi:hypothetical protein